jgi:hypothetical protein
LFVYSARKTIFGDSLSLIFDLLMCKNGFSSYFRQSITPKIERRYLSPSTSSPQALER